MAVGVGVGAGVAVGLGVGVGVVMNVGDGVGVDWQAASARTIATSVMKITHGRKAAPSTPRPFFFMPSSPPAVSAKSYLLLMGDLRLSYH